MFRDCGLLSRCIAEVLTAVVTPGCVRVPLDACVCACTQAAAGCTQWALLPGRVGFMGFRVWVWAKP